jgi:hypothetical protein
MESNLKWLWPKVISVFRFKKENPMTTPVTCAQLKQLRENLKDPKKHRRIVHNAFYELETYLDAEIEKRKP